MLKADQPTSTIAPGLNRARTGSSHKGHVTEIGKVAREIRRLEDVRRTLDNGDEAIAGRDREGEDSTVEGYQAARDRFLIGGASDVVDGKAQALRQLLVFENPTTFEDVTTLFNILEDELRRFHQEYIDNR